MWSQVEQALNQAASNVTAGLVRLLPGTIALVVSLLEAALVGWALGALLRRVLVAVDFDRRLTNLGWAEFGAWTDGGHAVVARHGWVLRGFLVGVAAFDPTLTSELTFRLFGSAIDLATAALLLVIGIVLARFLSRGILISLVNQNVQQARLISLGVKWRMLVLTAAMALNHLRVGGRIVELAFGILFGGIVFALALAVGLRSKDITDWSMAKPTDDVAPEGASKPFDHL